MPAAQLVDSLKDEMRHEWRSATHANGDGRMVLGLTQCFRKYRVARTIRPTLLPAFRSVRLPKLRRTQIGMLSNWMCAAERSRDNRRSMGKIVKNRRSPARARRSQTLDKYSTRCYISVGESV